MREQTFKLAGTGMALPALLLSSSAIDEELGQPTGSLFEACGVATRYVCQSETQDGLATEAATKALVDAGCTTDDIDLIVFGAAVSKQPIPSTAPLVARGLGLPPGACTAFDVNSTCLSFLTGVDVVAALLQTGRFRGALVVSSELASRALPWRTDPTTAGLFGDGAAAAVLLPPCANGQSSRIAAAYFETHHQGYEFCQLAAGGTGTDFHRDPEHFRANATFDMRGHDLFKLTIKHFPAFVDRLLDRAGWRRQDVDLVAPHQASSLALDHLVRRCGFAKSQVFDIVAQYGNQVAASIPIALHLARAEGRVSAGDKVLLLGTSAGVCFGGIAIEV